MLRPLARVMLTALTSILVLVAVDPQIDPDSSAHADESFPQHAVCKAAIAAIMGRDPTVIKIDRQAGDVAYLSYIRSDNTQWVYRCKLMGQRIMWGSDVGRWRDHPLDERIFFEPAANGKSLKIIQRWGDGSKTEKAYAREQLQ